MNWSNLHDATAQNDKPAPGWLFKEICSDAQRHPQEMPDIAEYLMRCVACDNRTVSMKACLAIRHLAEEVPTFRQYMQRCPEALAMLKESSAPPQLAQAASLERPEVKIAREAAARAWKSCLAPVSVEQETDSAQLKQRIQGFGNFEPPPPADQQEAAGARGLVDKVAGFVGDAVADTVDDFREKGAVGAVRDGIADAADLILDGVGAVWDFLGGRKNKAGGAPAEDRICRPLDERGIGGQSFVGPPLAQQGIAPMMPQSIAPMPQGIAPMPTVRPPAPSTFQGAFGHGSVGAGYTFSPEMFAPPATAAAAAASASASVAPPPPAASSNKVGDKAGAVTPSAAPAEPEDLLDFDDEPVSGATTDLLSSGSGGPSGGEPAKAVDLKNRGNQLVREKKPAEAVKVYEAALAAVAEAFGEDGHPALCAALHANIALCYLQQQLYRRAIDAATSSIKVDATHAKAYYRRCLAYKALKMNSEAQRDAEALQFCKHEMTAAEMQKLNQSLVAGPRGAGQGTDPPNEWPF